MEKIKIKLTESERAAFAYALLQYLQFSQERNFGNVYFNIMAAGNYRALMQKFDKTESTFFGNTAGKAKLYSITLPEAAALMLIYEKEITYEFDSYTQVTVLNIIQSIDKFFKNISHEKQQYRRIQD